jgi:hypothetical protein
MSEWNEPPETEQELLDGNVRIKKALKYSALFYTPIVVALLWFFAGDWWWIIAAAFVVGEFVSYPMLAKVVDRNTEAQVELLRARDASRPSFPGGD